MTGVWAIDLLEITPEHQLEIPSDSITSVLTLRVCTHLFLYVNYQRYLLDWDILADLDTVDFTDPSSNQLHAVLVVEEGFCVHSILLLHFLKLLLHVLGEFIKLQNTSTR